MKNKIFEKSVELEYPAETVFQWHAYPGALNRMAPPWDPLKVLKTDASILPGSQSLLKMKLGPFSYRWLAEHQNYQINRQFQDFQKKGPLSYWCHTHKFEVLEKKASRLVDKIEYRLPGFGFGDLIMGNSISGKLNRIFRYRHRVLDRDLNQHQKYSAEKRLTVLISGGGGVIGSTLIPFLTTGGHRVFRLVRDRKLIGKNHIYWNPNKCVVENDENHQFDVIIHLAGENIGEGRWTAIKKEKILESRIHTTQTLIAFMKSLSRKPRAFLSASAIGFYGNRSNQELTEGDPVGQDFISDICQHWEQEAKKAEDLGIRTCLLRIGVVLTPGGGALARLLWLFKLGLGAKLGKGDQYLSWIGIDDVLGSIYHIIFNTKITGPVNLTSPNPVTNAEFTATLASVLKTSANKSVPEWLIRKAFGQLGDEIVLSSTRAYPGILNEHDYSFLQPELNTYLKEQLGLG